ncbi:MAG TPA: CHAT domain-containing protein [Pyrinomonadaceae bacterium]|nr:CHAT domain-containing protein [Pyrinomonadaceae bacterium]
MKLINAESEDARVKLIAGESAGLTLGVVQAVNDSAFAKVRKEPNKEVERIARIGLLLSEQLHDAREQARALLTIGMVSEVPAEKAAALTRGLELSEQIRDSELIVRFLIYTGDDTGSLDKRLQILERAVNIAHGAGLEKLEAGALGRIGNIYTMKADYQTARDFQSKALRIRERLHDRFDISVSLNNLGILNATQYDLDAAEDDFARSLEIDRSVGDRGATAQDLYNLGNVLTEKGNYALAMKQYYESLQISEEINDDGGIGAVATNIANLYNVLGNYQLARNYLDRASRIADQTGKTIPQYALANYGDSYKGEGNYVKAIEYYQRLLELKGKQDLKDSFAETLNAIGDCYVLMSDAPKARTYFQRAFEISRVTGNNFRSFQSLLGIAQTQLMLKDFPALLETAEEAKTHFTKLHGVREFPELYVLVGQAHQNLGQPNAAKQNYAKAIEIVEDLRAQIGGTASGKLGYFRDKLQPYHLMVDLLVSQGSFDEALRYVEAAKARTLVEALSPGKLKIERSMTESETAREQLFKNEMVSIRAMIEKLPETADQKQKSELQDRLSRKRLEFEDFRTRLYAAHPELKVHRGEFSPITLREVAQLLPDSRSAALEYIVGEEKVHLFVITKDNAGQPFLKVHSILIKQKALSAESESYRSKLANGALGFGDQGRKLYELLVEPAKVELSGKTNLVIIPDRTLWSVPFQALKPGANSFLAERVAISYAPSLTALRQMSIKDPRRRGEEELVAFGNPSLGKETSDSIKRVFMEESLEPLPESERLVSELKQMYRGRSKLFTGSAATEHAAKNEVSKYRVVQFATHAILNDASPMYSHIVLSRKGDDPNEDGLLEAWEMMDLDLHADLVILSGCDTARGRVSNGEGVIGMTWAMFVAGAPTTLASQWKVEASSTTELMLEFHRQLLKVKGISKAEALRQASLKLLRAGKYKHPSYWGGWVLMGNGS